MKQKSLATIRLNQNVSKNRAGFIALLVSVTLLFMSTVAESAGGGKGVKSDAVKFEAISGSDIKRVILKAKAAERLGIETDKISEEWILRRQMVGGRIITGDQIEKPEKKGKGLFANQGKFNVRLASLTNKDAASSQQETGEASKSRAADEQWVEMMLSEGEWDRLLKDEPARILPLSTRDNLASEVLALPSGMEPVEDAKRTMLKLYYRLPDKGHGLTLYHRVRVELPLTSSADKQLVVPYSAVYYDAKGDAWVYTNTQPLVYERQRIHIKRIEGDLAVLSDGPAVGTQVVTVGASLLYGAEVVFGK